ncbi:unnamed protein product [marine sediment metagenome]|uniref:Uncharacterized protein n=1 Tax=marine sediment metagenome TaxID=412755 RepID=X0WFP4_9ZZZZ
MFKFHRIGFIDGGGKEVSSWLALIQTEEQMKAYLLYHGRDLAEIYMKIKDSPENKSGHTGNQRANVYKDLLAMKMERENKTSMPLVEAINYLSDITTKTMISIFMDEGSVYVNAKGGCRDTSIRNDGKITEEVFETCVNKDFVFPTLGNDVIKITNWPGCPHFYISVNGKNVEVDGVQKWKTIQGAEEAKTKYLRRNRYKGVKE